MEDNGKFFCILDKPNNKHRRNDINSKTELGNLSSIDFCMPRPESESLCNQVIMQFHNSCSLQMGNNILQQKSLMTTSL